MLDEYHIPYLFPGQGSADVQSWTAGSTAGAANIWIKPRGATFVYMWAIGGGGGGGGGAANTAGNGKAGGGGGGGSAATSALYLATDLPDILGVSPGPGGAGGAGGASNGSSGSDGGLGLQSLVYALRGTTGVGPRFMIVGAGGSGGGGTITPTGGSAGIAGTASAQITAEMSFCALSWLPAAGVGGTAGGANAAGTNLAIGTGLMISGGAGGGGTTSSTLAGGDISAVANTPFIANKGGAAVGGTPGSNGYRFGNYPYFVGGSGGCASNSVAGANGGNGCAYGTGGGGGGGGVGTGGNGGAGGPGFIQIVSW